MLFILIMYILLGLCNVTKPKNGDLHDSCFSNIKTPINSLFAGGFWSNLYHTFWFGKLIDIFSFYIAVPLNYRRTSKDELQQRNCLGTSCWKTTGGGGGWHFTPFYESILFPTDVSKNYWIGGKQRTPWSVAAFCCIWYVSDLYLLHVYRPVHIDKNPQKWKSVSNIKTGIQKKYPQKWNSFL